MKLSRLLRLLVFVAVLSLGGAGLFVRSHAAGQAPQTTFQETVVNLAAGRVLVVVAKGAILVGTVENPIETDTHLPVPVQIGSSRVAVLLGAVDWIAPESKQQIARLDQELPRLRGRNVQEAPRLGSPAGLEAADLEAVGDGLFYRLDELARGLHAKIELPPDEPLAELILAGYVAGYGAEVWRIDYKFAQSEESVGFWSTRVVKPTYVQFWPPEKGQPRNMLEFDYPPGNSRTEPAAPSLIELWHKKDSRLEQPAKSDVQSGSVGRSIFDGESNKVPAADVTQFLRGALDAIAPRDARETIATLGEESGFAWILAPPAEAVKPGLRPERPSGAPSLASPPR